MPYRTVERELLLKHAVQTKHDRCALIPKRRRTVQYQCSVTLSNQTTKNCTLVKTTRMDKHPQTHGQIKTTGVLRNENCLYHGTGTPLTTYSYREKRVALANYHTYGDVTESSDESLNIGIRYTVGRVESPAEIHGTVVARNHQPHHCTGGGSPTSKSNTFP